MDSLTHNTPVATLERDAFRAWLTSKSAGTVVGERRSCCGCPLAAYLGAHGWTLATVSTVYQGYVAGEFVSVKTLRWAREFMARIDRVAGRTITAADALAALDAVPQEEEGAA